MTGPGIRRSRFALVLIAGVLLAATVDGRQRDTVDTVRAGLQARYDIVALQGGVGLVPHDRTRDIRLIEVRDGAVAINGDTVTGRELRDRVGNDADLILQLSYLSAADQRRLVATPDAPPAAGAPQAPQAPETPQAPQAPEAPQAPDNDADRNVRRGGDVVRIMGPVTIDRDERVEGDVVVVMGNAYIDGEVDGDVTVVMGNAYLRPQSVVRNDVNVISGVLYRDPGSRVDGSIDNVAVGHPAFPGFNFGNFIRDTVAGRIGSLAGTIIRIGLLSLFALVIVAVARGPIENVADRTAAEPVRAGLVGFFAQLAFLPVLVITIVVLAVSIIGIPLLLLLPFAIFGLILMWVVGFTGVAYQAGRWINGRFGWEGRSPYATVFVGVVLIALVTLIARSAAIAGGRFFTFPLWATGFFIEYVAWTLGLGAVILAWLNRRRVVPPPLPAP